MNTKRDARKLDLIAKKDLDPRAVRVVVRKGLSKGAAGCAPEQLEVWSVIEVEYTDGLSTPGFEDHPHGLDNESVDRQTLLDGIRQLRNRRLPQQPPDCGVFPRARVVEFGFELTAQDAKTRRELPALQ